MKQLLPQRVFQQHRTFAQGGEQRVKIQQFRVAKGCCDCFAAGNRFAQRSLIVRFWTFGVVTPDLEQIKFLLGHSSIQTTERYLGSEQDIEIAVNDNLGL